MKKILIAIILLLPAILWAQPCNPVGQLPFEETFDTWGTGTSVRPDCWTMGGYSYYPYISSNTSGGELRLYVYNNSSSSNVVYACLPEMGSNIQINHTQLIMRLKGSSTNEYSSDLIIGICDTADVLSTFTPIDTLLNLPSTYGLYDISLEGYSGTGKWITLVSKQLTHGHNYYTNQVFLDNIVLEEIPSCRRTRNLRAYNATMTSVVLDWDELSQANSWEVTYGPSGYSEGTKVVANSKPYTLTGLTAGSQYQFNVRSICSVEDTGTEAISRCSFSTTQQPATLPYSFDFENNNEWEEWQSNSDNSTINWACGNATTYAGSHAAYLSADGGLSVGNDNYLTRVNACLYRDIDLGPIDSSYTLTFKARAGGTYDFMYDGLMVLIEDATHSVTTPTMDTTSPWGSISRLHPIATVRCDTTWRSYSASIDTTSGVKRLVFYWFNMNTSYYYSSINYPAAIDNIELDYSYCPRPISLSAETVSSSRVRISWDGPSTGSYEILLKRHSDSLYQSIYASTNPTLLTQLEGGMQYECMVRKMCGLEYSTYSEVLSFTTPCWDTVREYPYTETFEGGFLCWEQQYLMGDIDWTLHNGDAGTAHPVPAYEGSSNILLYNTNPTDQSTLLISPVFDLSHRENARLAFSHLHRMRSQRVDSLVVLYRTDEASEWAVLASYGDAVTDWRRDTLALPMIGNRYQIAFEGHTRFGFGIAIDKIILTADTLIIPLICNTPVQLHTIDYQQGDSVILDWTCDSNQQLWEIVKHSLTEEAADAYYVTAVHPVTISQLQLGQNRYGFAVRAICDTNFYSDWSNEIQITTRPQIGIDQTDGQQELFRLYPNPSTGDVTLQIEDPSQSFHIQIMDMAGRILKETLTTTGNDIIHLQLTRGCYLVKVWHPEGFSVKRITVL